MSFFNELNGVKTNQVEVLQDPVCFLKEQKTVKLSFLNPPPLTKEKRLPAEECLGGGSTGRTAVSSYSPTDQRG